MTRLEARHKILDAANAHRRSRALCSTPFTMRTLCRAVCSVRRQGGVPREIIVAAGFRTTPSKPRRISPAVRKAARVARHRSARKQNLARSA